MKIGSQTRPDRPRPRKTWKTGRKPRKPRNNKIDLFLRRPTFSRPTFKETCVFQFFNFLMISTFQLFNLFQFFNISTFQVCL